MAESAKVFKVWIALLASCREDGIANVSSVFLASACHLPMKDVDHAIEVLESPDPRSRSMNDDGRRIKRVDGGYFVINYLKYREFSYSDHPEAVRKREYRGRQKTMDDGTKWDMSQNVPFCPGHSASASVYLNKESSSISKGNTRGKRPKIFLNFDSWAWENITTEDMELWGKAYPAIDIPLALAQMAAWCKDHQDDGRGRKSNWSAFISRWLKKEQDKGGNRGRQFGKPDRLAGVREWADQRGLK